jgi:transposase
MGPLSLDLRKRVVSAVSEEGMSCRAAARRFGVSFSSAIRWIASLRERGDYAPSRWEAINARDALRRMPITFLALSDANRT